MLKYSSPVENHKEQVGFATAQTVSKHIYNLDTFGAYTVEYVVVQSLHMLIFSMCELLEKTRTYADISVQ